MSRDALNLDLLKRLCETPGAPGREHRVRALIEDEIKGLFDEVRTDAMGSLLCTRKPTKKTRGAKADPLKIMLLCHMDEIAFLVSHVDDKGFISVEPVGGFDPRSLFSAAGAGLHLPRRLQGGDEPGRQGSAHLQRRRAQEDP